MTKLNRTSLNTIESSRKGNSITISSSKRGSKRNSAMKKNVNSQNLRSQQGFEYLRSTTFQLPQEMCKYEVGCDLMRRKVIHVNKRPDREPFYTGPDRLNFNSVEFESGVLLESLE